MTKDKMDVIAQLRKLKCTSIYNYTTTDSVLHFVL